MKAQFEKIRPSNNSSFRAFVYEGDDFDAPWHFHPEFELTYIVAGEGVRYVGNSVQQFKAGDFVLLGSNLPHCWKNTSEKTSGVKSLVFQWDTNLLGVDWLDKSEFYSIKKLLKRASEGVCFHAIFSEKMAPKLHEIITNEPLEKLLEFLKLLEEISTVDSYKLLVTPGFTPILNSKTNQRIDVIQDFVANNFTTKIKLEDIAGTLAMGNEAFCRFFKKSLNKSFFTYLNEYRINMACKMLIESKKQVSQIGYECGYESLPFFYRQFDKYMNCSPLTFRKKYLKM
ncbi:transcriptional regulator with cupin sensor, AraC family [Cellulophaga algicola DSM 14237]|uniref:Transcriptional regulator with cupin sensor, AraC family n=1 Tax=Cellulophaga algicola (strain DSM 14237 / IC166 / ACAM 630) TaxID=688270 RepID=E6XF60_CELAD|nr:AraC family transcriptional regulator [Cellulophaga algicola]ADV50296.1 transcriptional regulator with cupin sensor, AraC family [Cellulophaga algicola DSM 14237]